MGSLLYGMVLGVVAGYFQIGVAGLFIAVGLLGVLAGMIRTKFLSLLVCGRCQTIVLTVIS